jgi:hypothetical protein
VSARRSRSYQQPAAPDANQQYTATLAGVVTALGGLGVAGLSAWKVVDLRSKVADMKADMARDGDEFGIAAAMADAVQARVGVGLWLMIGAGLAAAVCAGYVVLARRQGPPAS